jgi:phosphocarrier protein HPr
MKTTSVIVPWTEGLHLRLAAKLVRLAKRFRSEIQIQRGNLHAEATSILSVLLLCAAMSTTLQINADGPDEEEAVSAIEQFFTENPPGSS